MTDERSRTIRKHTTEQGFEGAGIGKLRGEIEFYQARKSVHSIGDLLPVLVTSAANDAEASLELPYIAQSWTLADQLVRESRLTRCLSPW